MRKIILELAVSLDGFIEGTNGEIDWCIFDEELAEELNTFIQRIDTVLYGRVSYQMFGDYTPAPDRLESEKQFYQSVNKMTKYVFSTTLEKVSGTATLIKDNIADRVQEIKKQPGKDIWLFGGAGLIDTLVKLNLIDEYRMGVHPVVLGSGKPLFKDLKTRINLKLVNTKTFKSGVVGLYYQKL